MSASTSATTCGEESEFLYHTVCPDCGSSDACSVYSDGHTYCFSCQTYHRGESTASMDSTSHRAAGLIPDGEYIALGKRCLSVETVRKFGYTVGTYRDKPVQIAPYRDRQGNIIAQHLRFPDKEFSWKGDSKEVCLFGQHLWRNTGGRMLIITEGEIDCMSVSQAQGNKYPVVSVPNGAQNAVKAIKRNLDFVESFESVVLAFDSDDAGRKAAQECAAILSVGKAKICEFPLKDANDMLKAGRVKDIISCIWEAKAWRPDGIISGTDLWEELIKPPVQGYMTPYPMLNAMTHGIRKGELALFTAGSGIGKSTLVNEIAYKLLTEDKLTIGVMALEESKKRTAERYVGMALNRPIHLSREGITEDMLLDAYNSVLANGRFWCYDHFGSSDIDTLLGKIRYMGVTLGVDFIILDHISIIVSGLNEQEESERKLIDMLMTRLRSLIEEIGIGVLAVVHLKRPDKGQSYNEGRPVSLTDLRGSGSLEQLSDLVISLERNQQSETESNIAVMRVLKNRPVGTTGVCDTLEYSNDTGRLTARSPFDFNEEEKGEEDF